MFAFFVGFFVIILIGSLSLLATLLLPLLLLLGIFARLIIGLLLGVFVIWLIGKVTLLSIEYLKNRSGPQ